MNDANNINQLGDQMQSRNIIQLEETRGLEVLNPTHAQKGRNLYAIPAITNAQYNSVCGDVVDDVHCRSIS